MLIVLKRIFGPSKPDINSYSAPSQVHPDAVLAAHRGPAWTAAVRAAVHSQGYHQLRPVQVQHAASEGVADHV